MRIWPFNGRFWSYKLTLRAVFEMWLVAMLIAAIWYIVNGCRR